jgi:hypothetical protein
MPSEISVTATEYLVHSNFVVTSGTEELNVREKTKVILLLLQVSIL